MGSHAASCSGPPAFLRERGFAAIDATREAEVAQKGYEGFALIPSAL